ncbi:hypothetical protein NN561_009205 [Cricetulus griseus]
MYQEAGFPGSRGKGGREASGDGDTGTPSHSGRTGNLFGLPRFRATQLGSLWGPRCLGGPGLRLPTRVSPGSSALRTRTMPPGRAAGTGYPRCGRQPLTCRASGRSPWEMARAIRRARWLAEAPEAQGQAPPAPNCGLQRGQRRPRGASSGPPRRSPSSPTGGARWRGGAPGSPPPGSGSPASPDRSGEPGAVQLRAHRAPFARDPAPVSSLPGVLLNPWATEISHPVEPAWVGETPARPVEH